MAGEENLEKTKAAYAAFQSGDAARAMEDLADDIEWIVLVEGPVVAGFGQIAGHNGTP